MPECAFCDHIGKLSLEHVISGWLSELFPGPVDARVKTADGPREFTSNAIDYKARVVCKRCNETWMSDIESQHAKPVLTPLVTGQRNIPIDLNTAKSIALFAFKTAVVVDCSNRKRNPFFSRHLRHAFRKDGFIPSFVQMWFCPFIGHRADAHVKTVYHEGKTTLGSSFKLYACTCAFGYFTFQVLAVHQIGDLGFRSLAGFKENLAVPFWPALPRGYIWPHNVALKTVEEFDVFAARWERIQFFGI
jgi:hypothetical protein